MLILFIYFVTRSSGKLVVPPPSLTDPSHTFVSRLRSLLYLIQRTTHERPEHRYGHTFAQLFIFGHVRKAAAYTDHLRWLRKVTTGKRYARQSVCPNGITQLPSARIYSC
jgi:hypothetical protein